MSLVRNRLIISHGRHVWLLKSRTRLPCFPSVHSSFPAATTTTTAIATFTTSRTGTDHHAFFQQQLEELENERKSLFGDEAPNKSDDLMSIARNKLLVNENEDATNDDSTGEYEIDMEELHAEREALFQFTYEEKEAWGRQSSEISGNPSETRLSPSLMKEIETARAAAPTNDESLPSASSSSELSSSSSLPQNQHHEFFSHVSSDGQSIHMVDVGHKQVTTRTARAQSKVILPQEVLDVLERNGSELIGPKGPIFATAKLAGIMAAKKTSDLIPLCHPLPLDQVLVDIRMSSENEIVIECTCRVTHKTGVEMEALMGASVAALTIYDMIKAVSHRVEITDTKLLSKTGGKRNIPTDEFL